MEGPLKGVRVIDLTTMISGPFATMILGDQGADVIKVERPGGGDQMRRYGRNSGALSAPFVNNNRNKRSITIDLKSPLGVDIVRRLIVNADVVIQNFRPGVIKKLGLGYERICDVQPDIVYVSISGFGDTGPFADKPAYDPIIQAVSGLASIQGGSDLERPRMIRAMLPDKLAALTITQAITAALYVKASTGEGQEIKLSMLDSVLSFLWSGEMDGHTFLENLVEGPEEMTPFDLIYQTKDGYICVATVTDGQWQGFAEAVGHAEWLNDPRFNTSKAREIHRSERLALMQEVLRSGKTDDWLERLEAADVPCAKTYTRSEIVKHPHILESKTLVEYGHGSAGPIRQARHPARFSKTKAEAMRPPPLLGQHTDEILKAAGYSSNKIDNLRNNGIID
ncbi:MAG: Acetyl-CoA:oxalate CoA-transferase [Alphaproteobacteria bacterium MarineAlpha3_Bin5]|nr:carnitine dehydratase [Magnetovibrio sp.]PPR75251.1 MAG: Acetyl-CoA:oxalate CoA-transferase [Alphaproteobacteria bacterium MarineAlpha3_Bin5]